MLLVAHPLERVVVQVDVRRLNVREGLGVDREAVILRRDLDLAGALVANGLVGPDDRT